MALAVEMAPSFPIFGFDKGDTAKCALVSARGGLENIHLACLHKHPFVDAISECCFAKYQGALVLGATGIGQRDRLSVLANCGMCVRLGHFHLYTICARRL